MSRDTDDVYAKQQPMRRYWVIATICLSTLLVSLDQSLDKDHRQGLILLASFLVSIVGILLACSRGGPAIRMNAGQVILLCAGSWISALGFGMFLSLFMPGFLEAYNLQAMLPLVTHPDDEWAMTGVLGSMFCIPLGLVILATMRKKWFS